MPSNKSATVVPSFETIFRYMPSAVYVGAAITWLIAFTSKDPPHIPLSREEVARRLREQEQALEELKEARLSACDQALLNRSFYRANSDGRQPTQKFAPFV